MDAGDKKYFSGLVDLRITVGKLRDVLTDLDRALAIFMEIESEKGISDDDPKETPREPPG